MVLEAPPLLQCHDFKNKNDLLDLGRIPGWAVKMILMELKITFSQFIIRGSSP